MITGVIATAAPQFASQMYGVIITGSNARLFGRAAGMRDVVVGGLLCVSGWHARSARLIGTHLLVASLIPIGDALIVLAMTQPLPTFAFALHFSSAVVLVGLGIWLRR